MTTYVPDYLQPTSDENAETEALLERAQRVEALAETQGWQDIRDFLLSLAHKEETTVITGRLDHDDYIRRTARIQALLQATDAPALIRQFAENRRTRPPEQEQ